jgi:GDP-L-fucose synthase
MRHYNDESSHINVGTGVDLSIGDLALMIRDIIHPSARLVFDATKPDGAPRKLLDVSRIHQLGWRHQIELREGIASVYDWFLKNHSTARGAGVGATAVAGETSTSSNR